MPHRLRIPEIVRGDDLEVTATLPVRPEEVAPDAPESVDSNPNFRHVVPPYSLSRRV
jgi:hypothetical protein